MRKIVNIYIVCDLDAWTKKPTDNFKFKNWLFGANSIVKYNDKEKYLYSGYGITFDSSAAWSFNNDTGRNVIISGSSSNSDNRKNNFLMLGKSPSSRVNETFVSPEKTLALILVKQT